MSEKKERKEINKNPLAHLNKGQTQRLENFFSMSAEDRGNSNDPSRNTDLQAIERFLSHT